MTLKAGFHQIDFDSYLSDPAPEPSLHASIVTKMIDGVSMKRIAAENVRLGGQRPDGSERGTSEQILGSVIHTLLLDAGKPFEVVTGFDDWRKKAAQEERERIEAGGACAILEKDHETALLVSGALAAALAAHYGRWPIGRSERMALWQKDTPYGPLWCRALMDHEAILSHGKILDVKTTGLPLSDFAISKAWAGGNDIQAAFYLEGAATLCPDARLVMEGGVEFDFVIAETTAPYEVRIATFPVDWQEAAQPAIDLATRTFAHCLSRNEWPGHDQTATIQCPAWRGERLMRYGLCGEEV